MTQSTETICVVKCNGRKEDGSPCQAHIRGFVGEHPLAVRQYLVSRLGWRCSDDPTGRDFCSDCSKKLKAGG